MYAKRLIKPIEEISDADIQKIAQILIDCRDKGGKIVLAGNGGSSAICSHFANDLIKALGIAAINLTDNVPSLTAYSNDKEYGTALGDIADVLIKKDDVLFLMSTSGKSINVLYLAFRFKNQTVALVGSNDCDLTRWHKHVNFVIAGGHDARSNEDIFSIITHSIVDCIEQSKE